MAKGMMKEVGGEVGKVLFGNEYAPERLRLWNLMWYASMMAVYTAKKPYVRATALVCGLWSTWAQQHETANWMCDVSDTLESIKRGR